MSSNVYTRRELEFIEAHYLAGESDQGIADRLNEGNFSRRHRTKKSILQARIQCRWLSEFEFQKHVELATNRCDQEMQARRGTELLAKRLQNAIDRGEEKAPVVIEDTRERRFAYISRPPTSMVGGSALGDCAED